MGRIRLSNSCVGSLVVVRLIAVFRCGAANRTRVLVMLPRQGLWFPDLSGARSGRSKHWDRTCLCGLSTEASQTLSTSVPGVAVPDVVLSSDLHATDFDAILFIGYDTSDFSPAGVAGEQTRRLINEFQFEKKVLAALCSGQRILASTAHCVASMWQQVSPSRTRKSK